MEAIAGIEYTKDVTGKKRYVQIDLDMYGENQLIEDFLDGLEAMKLKGEPTIPLREFINEQNKKRGLNV
ncbi:MAG: hypothetical protein LBL94_09495 [Prevotellaceae bacterium]|nr:hypothetical protein [Prevotellaceae bacterium]